MKSKRKWTDEQLREAVLVCETYSDVLRALGVKLLGGNFTTVKNHIKRLGLDTTHFTGKAKTRRKVSTKGKPLAEYLTTNSNYSRAALKKRLIDEGVFDLVCSKCGLGATWNDEPLVHHLDHVNGVSDDNRLENLRLLCPNCHSQTKTYSGKNSSRVGTAKSRYDTCVCGGRKRVESTVCIVCYEPLGRPATKKPPTCRTCGIEVSRLSKQCSSCYTPATKIAWPSDADLLRMVEKLSSYVAVGHALGVSEAAVRKRVKKIRQV